MAKKIQVPAIGGLRKVIIPGGTVQVGTTIAEFGANTVTLAQLAAALGTLVAPASGTIGGGGGGAPPASLALGPGLSGGGSLIGSVPIRLIAPLPFMVPDEAEDSPLVPGAGGSSSGVGPPGPAGPPGASGLSGVTVVLPADEYDDPVVIPGLHGTAGSAGATGLAGAIVYISPEESEDLGPPIPGPPGPPGAPGTGGSSVASIVFVPAEETEDAPIIPGPQGLPGANGTPGTGGISSSIYISPDEAEDAVIVPGPAGNPGNSSALTFDPYFIDVGLLLHMDGTNGSTVFPDSSQNSFAVTPHAATVSTAAPAFGTGCMVGGYLTIPIVAGGPLDLSALQPWTVEFWVNFPATNVSHNTIGLGDDGSANWVIMQFLGTGTANVFNVQGQFASGTSGGTFGSNSVNYTTGTWIHFALVSDGVHLGCFVGGIANGSLVALSAPSAPWSGNIFIGACDSGGVTGAQSIDEFRLTKGIARYPLGVNFTPPAQAFIAGAVLPSGLTGTITTAKLSTATGSMTFVNGMLVSQVAAT